MGFGVKASDITEAITATLGGGVNITDTNPLPVAQPEIAAEHPLVTAPSQVRLIDLDANYVNVWGYGENVYLGLVVGGFPDTTPCLIRTDVSGVLETLLTKAEVLALVPGASPGGAVQGFTEIVAVLEAPDGTLFCSTHHPVSILRKRPGLAWDDVLDTDFATAYGMGANWRGELFFTARRAAGYPPGYPARRSVYRSTDGGTIWAEVYGEAADWIFGLAFGPYDQMVVGARGGMLYSHDHGATFTPVAVAAGYATLRTPIPLRRSMFLIGSSQYRDIYMAVSVGAWEPLANLLPGPLTASINNLSVSNGVIIGTAYQIPWLMISQDEGATWKILELPFDGQHTRGCYLTGRTAFVGGALESGNPYEGESNVGKLAIIDLTELVPSQPEPFEMVSLATLVAGDTSSLTDCRPLKLNEGAGLALAVACTYDAAATAGLRIHVRSSHDNANYDDADLYQFDNEFAIGATRRKTVELDQRVRFIKVLVENLDGVAGHDITDLTVTAILGG